MSLTPEVFQRPMDRLKALAFKNIIPGWATPLQNIRKHFRSSQVAWKIKKIYQRNDGPDTHVGCSGCIPWANLFVEVFKSFKYFTHVLTGATSREMYSFTDISGRMMENHFAKQEGHGKGICSDFLGHAGAARGSSRQSVRDRRDIPLSNIPILFLHIRPEGAQLGNSQFHLEKTIWKWRLMHGVLF